MIFTVNEIKNYKENIEHSGLLATTMPYSEARKLHKIYDTLTEEVKVVIEETNKLLKEYCEVDEEGNLMNKDGNLIFKSDEDKEILENSLTDLNVSEIELDFIPVKIDLLSNIEIKPAIFSILKKILDFGE